LVAAAGMTGGVLVRREWDAEECTRRS